MIKIREAKTKKMPGLTSLFIQTPYNKLVVETIKSYGISDYDDKT